MAIKLVLLRHGKSTDNIGGIFSGWRDCDLADAGIAEAHAAGRKLKEGGYSFEVSFTSYLRRAIKTLWIALEELDLLWIPEVKDWRLNERHYGALQGRKHEEIEAKFGKEREFLWRRSFETRPPLLEDGDSRLAENEAKYSGIPGIPRGESLKDVIPRVSSFYHEMVVPLLKKRKRILISASHNSLRALVSYFEELPTEKIPELNIPTGIPLVYELDEESLKPLKHYYLASDEQVETALKSVRVSSGPVPGK
ncbi:MAG: 2,3-bisphosphoglycerate-dependent phosphoglycerate mutase [archaeon]